MTTGKPGAHRPLLLLSGLACALVAIGAYGRSDVPLVIEPDWRIDWRAATQQGKASASTDAVVRLSNGKQVHEQQLDRTVARHQGPDRWLPYHFSVGGAPVTTVAPGTDRHHHFVNRFLEGFVPMPKAEPWVPLYVIAHRKTYVEDPQQYGVREMWQTSRESMGNPRGDCEDHAIALADWLIGLGKDARVVLGTMNGGGHAWVVVRENEQTWLLEATRKRRTRHWSYPLASLHPEYVPREMFDRERWWQNTGGATVDYTGSHWLLGARFERPVASGANAASGS